MLDKRYIRKSGEITWIRVTAALVRGPCGTIESAVGILEDISARCPVEKPARPTASGNPRGIP